VCSPRTIEEALSAPTADGPASASWEVDSEEFVAGSTVALAAASWPVHREVSVSGAVD
jgi:hypothetical protein